MLVRMKKNNGFTLIELAMVIFIVGLLLGGLLAPLSSRLEQENRSKSRDYLSDVKEALLGFTIINGRLPCPDCPDSILCAVGTANDGIQDMVSGVVGGASGMICETNVGNVPWVDLYVSEFDSWGRHLTYRVSPNLADDISGTPAACDTATVGVSFELCAPGDIDIYNTYMAPGSYLASLIVADNVPAIVISHGKNGYDGSQTNVEVENYDRQPVNPAMGANILGSYTATDYSPTIFIMKDYDSEGNDAFDDLVDWLSPNILMNRMVVSGKLP
jgi:prepilin-type N-terminal cleavage/methylation domain-containing protein